MSHGIKTYVVATNRYNSVIFHVLFIYTVAPVHTHYYVSLLSFLDAKSHFVVILAIDEDCARHYL